MKTLHIILSFLPILIFPFAGITQQLQKAKNFSITVPLYHDIINTVEIKGFDTDTKIVSDVSSVSFNERTGNYEIEIYLTAKDSAVFYAINKTTKDTIGICKKVVLRLPQKETTQPEISLGDLKGKLVTPPLLRQQQQLKITGGYSLVSAVVYFSGPSFKVPIERTIFSEDLSPVKGLLDSCRGNDVIEFRTLLKTPAAKLMHGNWLVVKVGKVAQGTEPDFQYGYVHFTRCEAAIFKKQKEIFVSAGCEFISATVYFAGAAFPKAVKTALENAPLQPIDQLIQQCAPGTIVSFENIKIKKPNGEIITIEQRVYSLY
ncbi:hypothetical protein [Ferruginibacter sp.]